MQEKINYLKERIDNLAGIIGEEEVQDPKSKNANKYKTISDGISYVKMQLHDNSTVAMYTLRKSKYRKY